MPRLMSALRSGDESGTVDVNLRWGIDEQGIRFIRGRIDAALRVPCQRCLQDMVLKLNAEVALGVIGSLAEADFLPEPYEALVVETRSVALAGIVEDELLLTVPVVAMHEAPGCRPQGRAGDARGGTQGERKTPFAVLGTLKR
jgi:uncharacterized protein